MHHDLKVDDVPHGGERRTCFGGKGYRTISSKGFKRCLNFNKISWTLFEVWGQSCFSWPEFHAPSLSPKLFDVLASPGSCRNWQTSFWNTEAGQSKIGQELKNMSKRSSGFKPVIQWLQATAFLGGKENDWKAEADHWLSYGNGSFGTHIKVTSVFVSHSRCKTLEVLETWIYRMKHILNISFFHRRSATRKALDTFSWLLTCH